MPESFAQLPADSTGKKIHTRQRVIGANTIEDQFVIPVPDRVVSCYGAVGSFRTPGRATAAQNVFALHNATGSAVLVAVRKLSVESGQTAASVVMPVTVLMSRFTALPTNGTALTKQLVDTTLASNASVTAWGDASADGTGSATTLTITPVGRMQAVLSTQLYTVVGFADGFNHEFVQPGEPPIILRALEGVLLSLSTPTAAENIAARAFLASCSWEEFTLP